MHVYFLVYVSLRLALLGCAATSSKRASAPFQHAGLAHADDRFFDQAPNGHHQAPIIMDHVPGIQLLPPSADDDAADGGGGALTISDVLPQTRRINIFASLTRDVSSVTARLGSQAPTDNTTLLAPLNSVMTHLPRKPWEDRPSDTSGVSAARDEDKAAENMQRFVEEHVVPVSP